MYDIDLSTFKIMLQAIRELFEIKYGYINIKTRFILAFKFFGVNAFTFICQKYAQKIRAKYCIIF